MKKTLTLLYGLTFLICAIGQAQIVENELNNTETQLTEEQTQLIYEKTKSFPENTQLSIAIIESGKVKFIGIKRGNDAILQVENHQKIFEIGSISKVFTATLLSNLVVNNQLELEDPIQEFVDFEIKTNEAITLKELANHTSGLPRLPSNLNLFLADPSNPYKDYDEGKLKTYLNEDIKLTQAPGTKYDYSNLGAGLLGYLLAETSNSNYNQLLEEMIFSKYNMASSTTDRTNLKSEMVIGLDGSGKETSNWDLNVLAGAGGILSTVEDLSQFALAQFDSENTALQLTHQPTFTINENMQIGLGWHIIKLNDGNNEVIWHNGGTGGYTSSMAIDLQNKNGIIILSNVSAFNKSMGEIDNLCYGLIETMWEEKK